MADASPFPTLADPLVGEKPPFRPPRRSVFQLLWKAAFVASCAVAIVGHATGADGVWRGAYPIPTFCALVLVLTWRQRPGWRCPAYAWSVAAGMALQFFGDALLWEPQAWQLLHTSFLLFVAALLLYAFGMWSPSVPVERLGDPGVDTRRGAESAHAAAVPLAPYRLIPVAAAVAGAYLVWRGEGWPHQAELQPVSVVLAAQGLLLWRAGARVGYRVPVRSSMVHAAAVVKRPSRRGPTWERQEQQWAGLVGAALLVLEQAMVGYNALWLSGSAEFVPLSAACVHWCAIAAIAASVPVEGEPLPDLNDPVVCPPLYDGAPMRVLILLPDTDFDVTEVAVPWYFLRRRGHEVVFATEHGDCPSADPLLLTGVLCGQLGADPLPKLMYFDMERDPAFRSPVTWESVVPDAYDGLLLPGGHAPGMRQYLGSSLVQEKVQDFWQLDRPVGAICHGVLVLARTPAPGSRRHSVIYGATVTGLPSFMEMSAYALTCCCRGKYYRTYPESVEEEVRGAVGRRGQFLRGPVTFTRGSPWDSTHAYVVEHGKLITARWPGDAYLFARRFLAKLEEVQRLY